MASLKTITQFKSRLAGGGARPNLFEVNINDFKYADAWDNETFQFLCKTAALPASSITPVEIPFRGRILKFPVVVEVRVDGEVGQGDGEVLDRGQAEVAHTVLALVGHVPLAQSHQVHRIGFVLNK